MAYHEIRKVAKIELVVSFSFSCSFPLFSSLICICIYIYLLCLLWMYKKTCQGIHTPVWNGAWWFTIELGDDWNDIYLLKWQSATLYFLQGIPWQNIKYPAELLHSIAKWQRYDTLARCKISSNKYNNSKLWLLEE